MIKGASYQCFFADTVYKHRLLNNEIASVFNPPNTYRTFYQPVTLENSQVNL